MQKQRSLTKQRSQSLYKRVVVLFKTDWSLLTSLGFLCYKRKYRAICFSFEACLPPVQIEMKRKIDFVDEEHDNENEEGGSLDDESKDEEPRINDVLSNLSNAVSNERASDFLHSMATSRDILFWTPRGQLLRNKRIIPVTNIAELVEYVLLPHNDDATKPRALNTLLDGLTELGVDKGVIKNKKVLNDLIEKKRLPKWRKCFREREQSRKFIRKRGRGDSFCE